MIRIEAMRNWGYLGPSFDLIFYQISPGKILVLFYDIILILVPAF